jgi:hypothetical protein
VVFTAGFAAFFTQPLTIIGSLKKDSLEYIEANSLKAKIYQLKTSIAEVAYLLNNLVFANNALSEIVQ